jgi:hypothetical protein
MYILSELEETEEARGKPLIRIVVLSSEILS